MQAKLYGHRGARGERPENTLQGFHYAAALGVAGIETDIAVTADFVPVLHHDAALADGRLIKSLNSQDLPAEIPRLYEALRQVAVPEWLLEIKTYPDRPGDSHPPALMAEAVLAVLRHLPGAGVAILAFDWRVLAAVAALDPGLPRICLTAPDTAAARRLWWGAGYDDLTVPKAVAAAGAQGWACQHTALDLAGIAEARALGLRLLAWTVNGATAFSRLSPRVDAIITDYPARFRRA
jgi:glycerophosphoryl diester phosphodiesterase